MQNCDFYGNFQSFKTAMILSLFSFYARFEKLRKAAGSFDVSVRPHRTAWLPKDGFS